MSKEKTLKSSKFTVCYNKLRSNNELRDDLSKLSGSKLKSRLAEIFPTVEITGHFIRTAREILKESNRTNSKSSTNKKNIDSLDEDSNEKTDNFKEVASDKEESNENNNYTKKDSNLAEAIPSSNNFEKTKEFNYDSSLTANNTLTKINGVIIDKNKIKTIDEMSIEVNTLKKEIENKNSEIDLLKSQLTSAHEKIKSLSMASDEKQKQILEIQNSYPAISDNDGYKISFHPNMIYALKSAYVNSKFIDTGLLVKTGINADDYCVKKLFPKLFLIMVLKANIFKLQQRDFHIFLDSLFNILNELSSLIIIFKECYI